MWYDVNHNLTRAWRLPLNQNTYNMNLLSPVSTIMSDDLLTLSPSDSIAQAAAIFDNHKIHHIPVTIDGKLVGIVSMSDYLFFKRGFLNDRDDEMIESIRLNNYQVTYIMTEGIATIEPDDRINVAIEIFRENLFHAIPIVKDDELVGIVTTHDIIENLAKNNEAYAAYD